MFMKTRVLLPERMDDPNLDRDQHVRALCGLRRINWWSGNASLAWQPVRELAGELGTDRLRILDIATGAADIPISLWNKSQKHGLELEIEACDVSSTALEFAAENCQKAGAEVRLFPLDILQDSCDQSYDLVMCSQFLHHFADEQAQAIVRTMARLATRRVIIIDLVRSRLNWLIVCFASHALSRSPVVHFDGPQSIRAAYTVTEMKAIARRADLAHFEIRKHWPCRFVLIGSVEPTVGN